MLLCSGLELIGYYSGFFLVPCLGVFIDVLGHRASVCEWEMQSPKGCGYTD
jgi:hypothetical protein